MRILRRLFSQEEAEIYLHLSDKLETPQEVAKRAKQDPRKVSVILKRMAEKGLTFPKRKGDMFYYAAAPYAHGIYEHQVNTMDRDLALLFEEYMFAEKVPREPKPGEQIEGEMPLRTIPVRSSVSVSRAVATYEDVEGMIRSKDRIAVAKCVCAVQKGLVEPGCNQPLEVCLLFDFYAEYYVEMGNARAIGQEEALEILDLSEKAGLVHQSANLLDPGAICNCCRDCCGELRILRMLPNPAAFVASNYFSQVDTQLCNGCEACVDRCPMGAITIGPEEAAIIDLDKCIGCGLCVKPCPTEALILMSKPEEARQVPPPTSPFMRASEDYESSIP